MAAFIIYAFLPMRLFQIFPFLHYQYGFFLLPLPSFHINAHARPLIRIALLELFFTTV